MPRDVPPADSAAPIAGTDRILLDFWRWAYSDLVSNDVRGVLAEYLVGSALGVVDGTRVSWAAYDLTYRGVGIEVKATGDHQSWPGPPARPVWSIRAALPWDAENNVYGAERIRSAALYVFCHWRGADDSPLKPLRSDTWDFHVVPTAVLDRELPLARSISLAGVRRLVSAGGAATCGYVELKSTIDRLLAPHDGAPAEGRPGRI